MGYEESKLVVDYIKEHPEDTIIDHWTLFQDSKGIGTIKIQNLIRNDIKVITPRYISVQDSIISILNQVMFLNDSATEDTTKPARAKLNTVRVGPLDIFFTFDEANSFKHKCKYKKVGYSDGTIFTPVAQEITVQHGGNDPIYHHFIWTNNELNGSYLHIDSITNDGHLVKYNGGKVASRSFHLVHKFNWSHFGQTKFYHFDDRSDVKYWPILLTSEGLMYETDDFKFKRVCEKKSDRIEILNIFTT